MFVGSVIRLEGDERVTLDVGPWGTRVMIRDGSTSVTLDVRGQGTAHALAEAFAEAAESMAAEKAALVGMLSERASVA